MATIYNSEPASANNCCISPAYKPCAAQPPKAVWVAPATGHGGDCAIKAWLIQICVMDFLTSSYESDLNDAPSGTPLAGAFDDWLPAVPPTKVFVCNIDTTPKFDREFAILCAPDGTKVITQNVTPEDAPLGTAPVIEAWTLAGAAYTGDINALTDCGAEKIDVTAAQWFCAGGIPISRTDFWDVFSTPRTLIGSLWQDTSGAVIPTPAFGSYVVGDCSSCVSVINNDADAWAI